MLNEAPLRVVQWTTGHVGVEAVRAIVARPNLELVGVYAYSSDKAGRDVGELAELGRDVGVRATGDIDALLALEPDCVVYTPLRFNIDHMEKILRAGVNIVTTTGNFVTDRLCTENDRRRLGDAARAGNASLFGSGMHPGWCDAMLVHATGICSKVHRVRAIESVNLGAFAGDANQNAMGVGDVPRTIRVIAKTSSPA